MFMFTLLAPAFTMLPFMVTQTVYMPTLRVTGVFHRSGQTTDNRFSLFGRKIYLCVELYGTMRVIERLFAALLLLLGVAAQPLRYRCQYR